MFSGLLWLVVQSASAQDADYHLFHPVPRDQMRELSTDRPNTTQGPLTVDAGHVQVETELIAVGLDRDAAVSTTEVDWFTTELRLGVLSFMELQLIVEPYGRTVISRGTERVVSDGMGAITTLLKINLWGNDSGSTAFCIVPLIQYVDSGVDFGLNEGFAGELPGDFEYGLMLAENLTRIDDEEGDERGLELVASGVLGRELVAPLAGFVELVWTVATYDASLSTLAFNTGLTAIFLTDFQVDAGARVGIAGPISDIQLFGGLSARL